MQEQEFACGDGHEALRQLTLALRPSSSGRGLALMSALTSWPSFAMNQQLQPQLLRLEDALEEARKAGATIPDQLKQAILLKSVSGQLRTHLNLAIQETTTFAELRDHVLRWDRSQQRWNGLLFSDEAASSTAAPMEVDRIYSSGKKGGKDKGKGWQQKGQQKGKGKSKTKSKGDGKSNNKGKHKGDGKSKSGGKSNDSTGYKGKGNSTSGVCHRCGKPGHYARDCWASNVRAVQSEGQQLPHPQASQPLQSSPSSTAVGTPSSGAQQQSSTQFRVARIHEFEFQGSSDVQRHDEVVFDLRSPASNASRHEGSVRVVRYYIGDELSGFENGSVRAIVESIPENTSMCSILLDSGADASIFPASMAEFGVQSDRPKSKLHDAQGNSIPIQGMRDVELHLADVHGRSIVIKETVAISSHIHQPILCFGHLLESGWGVNGQHQTLIHGSGIQVPIELQHHSMSVRGWVRVLREEPQQCESLSVRVVKVDVVEDLAGMRVGWELNAQGVGRGKHFANCFQDPTVVCPSMAGSKFRTTLVRDGGQWLVMELCEPMETLIDLSSEFHGFNGSDRYVLTIITDNDCPPETMGFRLMNEGEEPLMPQAHAIDIDVAAPVAPEDEDAIVGVEIDGERDVAGGMEIHGQPVIAPERDDHLSVNGVEIYRNTALATMREACQFYHVSTSGGKARCFQRLWDFQKKLELQTALAAAKASQASQERLPRPQHLAEPPTEEEQQIHNLTHMPYKDWCAARVAHRSRQDRQARDGCVKRGEIPTVSFDFAYTRALAADGTVQNTEQVIALVMVDSQTNYTGCVPVKAKSQFDLMVREILQFTQVLGHGEVCFLCDNEPSIRQVQARAVKARLAQGLSTHSKTPAAYSHGNSLCENTIGRVRSLAGSLMFQLQEKISMELSTNNSIWPWAMRHASWLLNRFGVTHGTTPYELVYSKPYKGKLASFGEPIFAYVNVAQKGNAKWQRVIMLRKTESQDTFVVFTGSGVMLTKSVRRIQCDWKSHLGFYIHFNAPTWQFRAGFGGRIIPTKRTVEPIPESAQPPVGPILPSMLHDADGEAVRQKADEERKEESETSAMGKEDPMLQRGREQPLQSSAKASGSDAAPTAAVPASSAELPHVPVELQDDEIDMSFLAEMERELAEEDAKHVPMTPPVISAPVPASPRASPTSRAHNEGGDESHESKKAKVESQKKLRIGMLRESHEKMIRVVKIGEKEYHTMDNYEHDPSLDSADDGFQDDDIWHDEDMLQFTEVPEQLWSDAPIDVPPGPPDPWIDKLADQVEIARLLSMGVLQKRDDFGGMVEGSLTTRFVYDWRLKSYEVKSENQEDGSASVSSVKRWMRRSRFVAREFATTKRDDVYSPATGCHCSNIIPIIFLQTLRQLEMSGLQDEQYDVILAALDIKDAFLQAPQEHVVAVVLDGVEYVVLKNLPGQRL